MTELAPVRDRIIRLPGGKPMAVAEYGDMDGLPVLALHGAPASRLMYALGHDAATREGLRLIAPDRPGYGGTPPRSIITVVDYAKELEALADTLQLDRFALLGISGGGPYAAAAAARLARRITALGLVSPLGPVGELPDDVPMTSRQSLFFRTLPKYTRLTRAGARLAVGLFRLSPATFAGLFVAFLCPPDRKTLAPDKARADVIAMFTEAIRQGVDGALTDYEAYARPWGTDLSAITAPAVLWQGTADFVVPYEAAFHLARLIPGCRLERIAGGGHFWIYDNAPHVLSVVGGLIRGQTAA